MKPASIFREIVHHIFHMLGLPVSSERQYWTDANYQANDSSIKNQWTLEDHLSTFIQITETLMQGKSRYLKYIYIVRWIKETRWINK